MEYELQKVECPRCARREDKSIMTWWSGDPDRKAECYRCYYRWQPTTDEVGALAEIVTARAALLGDEV